MPHAVGIVVRQAGLAREIAAGIGHFITDSQGAEARSSRVRNGDAGATH